MYITCLELPIFEEKIVRPQTWRKRASFYERYFCTKETEHVSPFFSTFLFLLPHTLWSTATSKRVIIPLLSSFPLLIFNRVLIYFGSPPQVTATPDSSGVWWFWPQVLLAEQGYRRTNSIVNLTTDPLVRQLQIKNFIIFENNQVSLSETKQTKSKRRNKAPKHQKKSVSGDNYWLFFFFFF